MQSTQYKISPFHYFLQKIMGTDFNCKHCSLSILSFIMLHFKSSFSCAPFNSSSSLEHDSHSVISDCVSTVWQALTIGLLRFLLLTLRSLPPVFHPTHQFVLFQHPASLLIHIIPWLVARLTMMTVLLLQSCFFSKINDLKCNKGAQSGFLSALESTGFT